MPLGSSTLAITGCFNKQLLFDAKDERMNSCGKSQLASLGRSKSTWTGLVGTAAVLGSCESGSGQGSGHNRGRERRENPVVGMHP